VEAQSGFVCCPVSGSALLMQSWVVDTAAALVVTSNPAIPSLRADETENATSTSLKLYMTILLFLTNT
jgi:hypothetical protein